LQNQLPNPDNGCEYYEFDVGAAHPEAVHGPGEGDRGVRRLVVEVNVKPRKVREIYFSDSHYARGTFQRVVT
jgi:guanyl-specific ribonuclease Sa